jgi:hypothetical protein
MSFRQVKKNYIILKERSNETKKPSIILKEKPSIILKEKSSIILKEKSSIILKEKSSIILKEKPSIILKEKSNQTKKSSIILKEKPSLSEYCINSITMEDIDNLILTAQTQADIEYNKIKESESSSSSSRLTSMHSISTNVSSKEALEKILLQKKIDHLFRELI